MIPDQWHVRVLWWRWRVAPADLPFELTVPTVWRRPELGVNLCKWALGGAPVVEVSNMCMDSWHPRRQHVVKYLNRSMHAQPGLVKS